MLSGYAEEAKAAERLEQCAVGGRADRVGAHLLLDGRPLVARDRVHAEVGVVERQLELLVLDELRGEHIALAAGVDAEHAPPIIA